LALKSAQQKTKLKKRLFSLEGKKALITGAAGGIGSGITKVLHDKGATVLAVGTNDAKLTELCLELQNTRIHKQVCDLSQTEQIQNLIDSAIETLEGIDILVCNAGVTKDGLAIRMTEFDFDLVLNINLKATFMLNKLVLRHMLKRQCGRVINVSSVTAFTGNPGQANYCASKAGMIGMSKSLAREVAMRNITVNCIAPGFIQTPMTDKLSEDLQRQVIANIPIGKMGAPLDIAYAALYLASDEASYVTGTTLHVNGGLFMN
jgi:3-oxoacyl-[acyl-carrier protein] reductase